MSATFMQRIYLYVPPKEYAEVNAAGACWDGSSKRWYIGSDVAPATFARWLGRQAGDEDFGILSEEALVAAAQTSCLQCGERIEVICIYCESGTDVEQGEPLLRVTLSNIWAMDDALAGQLERWPQFRKVTGGDPGEESFANHCPHCGAVQEDTLLHDEPGDVFFGISRAEPGAVAPEPRWPQLPAQVAGRWC